MIGGMSMSTEQVIEAALKLPLEERAKVWEKLEESFEQAEEDEALDPEEQAACASLHGYFLYFGSLEKDSRQVEPE